MGQGSAQEVVDNRDTFLALSSFAPPAVHDGFSQRNLRQALLDAHTRNFSRLSKFRWELNGERIPSLAALLLPEKVVGKVGLIFYQPTMKKEAWEFTIPSAAMAFDPKGAGKIVTFHYDPKSITPWNLDDPGTEEPAVIRFSISDAFIPRSVKMEKEALEGNLPPAPPFELFSLAELSKFVHMTGVVPLRILLQVYTSKTRYSYDLDIVNNVLIQDPRSGRFSITERVNRSSRLSHGLDRYVARREIPPVPSRILEMLFESSGLNPTDVAVVLGISNNLATASLQTLEERKLARWDKGTMTYLPLPRAFLTAAEAEREAKDEESAIKKALATQVSSTGPSPPSSEPTSTMAEPTQVRVPPEPLIVNTDSARTTMETAPHTPISPPSVEKGQFPAAPAYARTPDISGVRGQVEELLKMLEENQVCPVCGRKMESSETEIVCGLCLKEMEESPQ